jgi:hypothetical protein
MILHPLVGYDIILHVLLHLNLSRLSAKEHSRSLPGELGFILAHRLSRKERSGLGVVTAASYALSQPLSQRERERWISVDTASDFP